MRDFSVKRLSIFTDMVFVAFALIFVSLNVIQISPEVVCSRYQLELTAFSENQTVVGGPYRDPFSNHKVHLCDLLNTPGTAFVSIQNLGEQFSVRNPTDPFVHDLLAMIVLIILFLYKIGSLIYLYVWGRNS